MTDREKLIELIGKARQAMHGEGLNCRLANDHFFVDYLLAHGVTFHKTGHWKHRKSWDKYVCSECGYEHDEPHNYCPNPECGAKMEGE